MFISWLESGAEGATPPAHTDSEGAVVASPAPAADEGEEKPTEPEDESAATEGGYEIYAAFVVFFCPPQIVSNLLLCSVGLAWTFLVFFGCPD